MQFSHIYVEKEALNYPLCKKTMQVFPSAKIIEIDKYKKFFNRPRQNFMLQRKSPKLILAIQNNSFLEEGSNRVRSFGNSHIISCSMIRNCMYHCDYCFLQGMHESSNIVIYVNIEDFEKEVIKRHNTAIKKNEQIYLIASYLSDLPAFEYFIPICKTWMDITRNLQNITLEIRTKSDGFTHLQYYAPPSNTVLVFSMTPDPLVKKYEHGCSSLFTRIFHADMAIKLGWRVRLCFDPILYSEDWKGIYTQCLQSIFSRINEKNIEMVSYGVFRMGKTYLKKMRSQVPHIGILKDKIIVQNGLATYSKSIIKEIQEDFFHMLNTYLSHKKIHFVHD